MAFNDVVLPQSPRLSQASRCSIADISPDVQDRASKFIHGVVSLIWPYSSASRQLAVLIAERDFRIRKAKGQTKIVFHGDAAVAVAESQVGIGDTVHLSLGGAQWTQTSQDVPTPGKRADWDLEYAGELFMEVHRDAIPLTVIDVPHVEERTCQPLRGISGNGGSDEGTPRASKHKESWSSPLFAKQTAHPSSPPENTALKHFVEDDGYIPGKGRKRTRFSRDSGSWRYVEKDSSSDDENGGLGPASPKNFRKDATEPISKALDFESGERREAVEDVKEASKQRSPRLEHDYDSAAELDRALDTSVPALTPFAVVVASGSPSIRPTDEVEEMSVREGGHPQTEHTVLFREAAALRSLPSSPSRLPPISSFVEQQSAFKENFPLISSKQLEFDPSAETASRSLCRESPADENMLPTRAEPSTGQLASILSGGDAGKTVLHSAGEVIDLTSPTDDNDHPRGAGTGQDLQIETSASEDDALNSERPIAPDEFEILSDSDVIPQPDYRKSMTDVHHRSSMSLAEMNLPESWTQSHFSGERFQDAVPSHFYEAAQDSKEVVPHSKDTILRMSQLEQPARGSINQPDDTLGPHLLRTSFAVDQHGVEREQILPNVSFASQKSSDWAETREISTVDIEGKGLSMSPPSLPFKQGWDADDKREDKAHQGQQMQAVGGYMSDSRFYDRAEDTARNLSTQESDDSFRTYSERESLNPDVEGRLICGETEKLGKRPKYRDEDTEPAAQDGSTTAKTEVNEPQIVEAIWTSALDNQAHFLEEPGLDREMIAQSNQRRYNHLEVSSELQGDELHSSEGGLEHKTIPLAEDQDYTRKLPEITSSQDTTVRTVSPTKADLNDAHIANHTPILPDTASGNVADTVFQTPSKDFLSTVNQLATPTNTQEEVRHTQARDLLENSFVETSGVKLPPSPQNTQELQGNEETRLEEVLDTLEGNNVLRATDEQLKSRLQQRGTFEEFDTMFPEELRRRRSSRLSERMPLLATDPAGIVSPYFTPKRVVQYFEREKAGEGPPLRVQEPIARATQSSARPPLPNRHPSANGFTTPHSYYPPLSTLPTHFDDQVDIIAVSTITCKHPQRAKFGPKDYFVSLKFADSSCAAGDTVSIQLFRPHKAALPACQRGDILLLRDVKVQTRRTLGKRGKEQEERLLDGMMLLSTDSSAWAVFSFPTADAAPLTDKSPDPIQGPARSPAKRGAFDKMDVQVSGPPVEFGAEERAFAKGLYKWWVEEGQGSFPDSGNNPSREIRGSKKLQEHICEIESGENGNLDTPRSVQEHVGFDSQSPVEDTAEVLHEHELRDGMAYGDTISPKPMHEHQHYHDLDHSVISTDAAADNAVPEEEATLHEHELRDGMAYGDTISPKPLHEHFPHDDHHSNSHESHVSSPLLHPHDQETTLTIVSPQQQMEHSHILRNGISYGEPTTPVPSPPLPATAKASTHQSEDAEESVHGLRSGRKYAMSSPSASSRPRSSESTSAKTTATKPPVRRSKRRGN